MTRARAYPTLIRHHDGHRLVNDFNLCDRPLLSLDKGSTLVTKRFGIRLDFLHHQPLEAVGVVEDVFEFDLVLAQLTQLLFNLNGLQPGQLAQADFEDVLGLTLGQLEARDEGLFGFIALADDGYHLVNVQQYQLATFQDMNPVKHFAQAVLTALDDGVLAEANPFRQHAPQRLRHRLTINPDHGQVDAAGGLQAGVRQQLGDQLGLRDGAGFRLKHQANRSLFARFVAHHIQHRQHAGLELCLLSAERFFTRLDFGVGDFFDFLKNPLRTHARR